MCSTRLGKLLHAGEPQDRNGLPASTLSVKADSEIFQPAQAGFVSVDVVSTALSIFRANRRSQIPHVSRPVRY
ncbi:MAG: hypothetical protein WBC69_05185 [Geitlerinemataceae cyanobacterium]